MFLAAAKALAASLPQATLRAGGLFPPIDDVRQVSRAVATAVFAQAVHEHVAPPVDDIDAAIAAEVWEPSYIPYRAV